MADLKNYVRFSEKKDVQITVRENCLKSANIIQ